MIENCKLQLSIIDVYIYEETKSLTRPLTEKIVRTKGQRKTFLFQKKIFLKILTYYLTNNLGIILCRKYKPLYKKTRHKFSSFDFIFEISAKKCFRKNLLSDAHMSKIFSDGTAAV